MTQKEAVSMAKEIAKNQKSEVLNHGKDLKIRVKVSFIPFPLTFPNLNNMYLQSMSVGMNKGRKLTTKIDYIN